MIDTTALFHELFQKTRFITKEVNEKLKQYDLYSSQWSIIYCLKTLGPSTQTDIWRYLNVEAPTVTRTITRLEKSGWVIRMEGNDKRERIIQLTEKANELIPQLEETVKAFEREMIGNLSDDEQQELLRLIKKMGANERS
ncbi:MarR family winged helix-turn-helix transcriptional regulator [Metabacillus fastidiosus]|uniref:MarR family transcriptional regulator n=1 Tax=Metabacillus fastidiosus TaxID=1458 RepID=A0ABU6P281_9BACI|nr:MarR family transcriptional regulator [Metabacillus fastidiosus]MED4403467.1 MarR family transcriptional regulator [Metabacillus fastidiosus]MED4454063.1 MarR family transcriptional regulator [Metabacillus fastidiosus]MED4460821.1 MarR family transcriptional regulator [Metabacillus fastidiosus]MED4534600.1 MarR family transcriptional regulator [Metabacillus fastidiosus]